MNTDEMKAESRAMNEEEFRAACVAAELDPEYVLALSRDEGFSLVAMRLLARQAIPVLLFRDEIGPYCAIGVLNKQYGDSYEEAAIRACMAARET